MISRRTHEALVRVMAFFGIDEYNKPLLGDAAAKAGVDAFSKTIEAVDAVIAADPRRGVNLRIRQRIDEEKALAQSGKLGSVMAKGRR